jgi:hypothetical protein
MWFLSAVHGLTLQQRIRMRPLKQSEREAAGEPGNRSVGWLRLRRQQRGELLDRMLCSGKHAQVLRLLHWFEHIAELH